MRACVSVCKRAAATVSQPYGLSFFLPGCAVPDHFLTPNCHRVPSQRVQVREQPVNSLRMFARM